MKPSLMRASIRACIETQQPFLVWGDPGVGKSEIMQQIADELYAEQYGYQSNGNGSVQRKKKTQPLTTLYKSLMYSEPPNEILPHEPRAWLRDFRMVTFNPVDINGYPYEVNGRMRFATPEILPTAGCGLMFFDEINRASKSLQNTALQLTLDRQTSGGYVMPREWSQGAAGNYEKDGGVERMSEALASRFVHLTLEPDVDDLIAYAKSRNWDGSVPAYLKFSPESMHKYSREAIRVEKAHPCPRTWEKVATFVARRYPKEVEAALILGTIGKAVGGQFLAFLQMYRDLPDIDDIVAQPKTTPVPTSPSLCYAVASALARIAENGNVTNILTYLNRFTEQEYTVVAVKEMTDRNPKLHTHPAVKQWKIAHAAVML